MKQYLDLLKNIITNGVEKESGRENMPNTIGISHADIKMDLSDGFPLLTTKKMHYKGIIHELLWFIRGETNIKYLVDNNTNIWNGDAYRWYLKHRELGIEAYNRMNTYETIDGKNTLSGRLDLDVPYSMETFVEMIKNSDRSMTVASLGNKYMLGDLGKVYGYQWRNQNGVDQVKDVVDGLKSNPYSRYHIIDGWNKADFREMALPPCHLLYQFIVRPLTFKERRDLAREYAEANNKLPLAIYAFGDKGIPSYMDVIDNTGWNIPKFYLDLNMYQRSCDTFLGVGFNIASMSILLKIMAKVSGMVAGVAYWTGGDTHVYVDHIHAINEQLSRTPTKLPELEILKDLKTLEDIESLTIDDFKLIDYVSLPAIKAELFTGLKK